MIKVKSQIAENIKIKDSKNYKAVIGNFKLINNED